MALRGWLPGHLFTPRGWGMLAAGAASLAAAHIMGRRDLLALAILLVVLPLASLAGLRLVHPRFRVARTFTPSPVETSAPVTVHLRVARTGPGSGRAVMEERLPARFGESPSFRFPSRAATGGTSRYEYRLRPAQRGQFRIGPVTAEFTDPFGLSLHRQAIDDGETLTVTPAAVVLPRTVLAGARGHDGATATRSRANPSDDDVMTREYRHGDPMRRVHWAATARHGELMVRQEESVTTPEATILLDLRAAAFPGGNHDGGMAAGSLAFEWAVVAAMSVSSHLAGRSHALRVLDQHGAPAFRHSPSAPEPEAEEYAGSSGLQSIAESLAAIQPAVAHREVRGQKVPRHADPDSQPAPFDDGLMDKLSAHRMRGPLVAVLGRITVAEARALAPAAAYATTAMAVVATDAPAEVADALELLRSAGWHAVAAAPGVSPADAWGRLDAGRASQAATGAGPRRSAGAVQ
ncbi:DUF58 domain-containing protein [Pseudarthrobacter sp. NPDC058362]|uniref:DUF58 domain-containing protein n=1 Tax=Pseudarthrobacter sp. NPDC058362 TaxID=3346458 RepID=UPI0036479FD4